MIKNTLYYTNLNQHFINCSVEDLEEVASSNSLFDIIGSEGIKELDYEARNKSID